MKIPLRWLPWIGLGVLCCGWLARGGVVSADEPATLVRPLETAIQKYVADQRDAVAERHGRPSASGAGNDNDFRLTRSLESGATLARLREAIAQKDVTVVDHVLDQIASDIPSEAVRTACRQLREGVHRRNEALMQESAGQIQTILAGVARDLRAAVKPADLDVTLQRLSAARLPAVGVYSTGTAATFNVGLDQAQSCVTAWQDYLSARQSGNFALAVQRLESTTAYLSPGLLDRSEVLSRVENLKAEQNAPGSSRLGRILAGLKTLDDLTPVLLALRRVDKASDNYDTMSAQRIVNELEGCSQAYNEYKAGLPNQASAGSPDSYYTMISVPVEVMNVRAQLMRLTCARELEVEDRLKPGPDEPISDYLKRVMADARERCDARLMLRSQKLVNRALKDHSLRPNDGRADGFADDALKALQALLAAQNQEEAGQFIPAVIAYQTALKLGGEYVMPRAVGQRLDAIKAAHPKDFDQAMQIALSGPP